ncbi:MAG TPA: membrane protein insertase YidC [Mycobacteriales bacterium]|nr:membrane protein insertase YidC [Mycobacteriales bacterium]
MLDWLYTAISWVLLRWHQLWGLVISPDSGAAWLLSIVFLVVSLRLLLFPLFVKQVHSMEKMKVLQPKMQAIRQKYKDDRQAQTRAMMELQKESGANPLGGCLPLLAQAPVFLALYHVLRHIKHGAEALYSWSPHQMESAVDATLLGAPLPASFRHHLGADGTTVNIIVVILLVISCAATFTTQWQSYQRNRANLDPQQERIQKFLMYVMPVGLLFSGLVFSFPLGILIYWVTNNVWTMGQQYYIFRRMHQKQQKTEETTKVDATQLAPRPGQKPTRTKSGAQKQVTQKQAGTKQAGTKSTATKQPGQNATGSKPKAGQKPAAQKRTGQKAAGSAPEKQTGSKPNPQKRTTKPRTGPATPAVATEGASDGPVSRATPAQSRSTQGPKRPTTNPQQRKKKRR